jgi:Uma2 family endonuclease
MTALAAQSPAVVQVPVSKTGSPGIPWEQFQRRYLSREDRFKYEWVDGAVEKTFRLMNQEQQRILVNLENFLELLFAPGKPPGRLLSEVDTFFRGNHRRPDIAWFTNDQIALFGKENQVPPFVIEIISTNDQINLVQKKMADYRRAGVPVVWQVFPELREIHVYKNEEMTICSGDKLCSAEPVISGFKLPAQAVLGQK